MMVLGRIHSIESMGLVDGPGIRAVIFFQGCRLRCCYCHNPDTWQMAEEGNLVLSAEALVARMSRFKTYWGNNGGITCSGGEPLLQSDFLKTFLPLCKQAGIHTCLDTAGCGDGDYADILKYTDLVLYDIKHYTEEGYQRITGWPMRATQQFLEAVQRHDIPLWIRHVVVPTLTDGDKHFEGLEKYLQTIRGIEKVELLPYHTLGVHKYDTLHLSYSLKEVQRVEASTLQAWEKRLNTNCVTLK